jgi:transitional endoplasmic reticulum ATPase
MMMPDQADREAIFAVHLRQKPMAKEIQTVTLAGKTEGFSGADIAAVVRKAAMTAVRRAVKTLEKGAAGEPDILIQRQDLEDALEEVRRGMG